MYIQLSSIYQIYSNHFIGQIHRVNTAILSPIRGQSECEQTIAYIMIMSCSLSAMCVGGQRYSKCGGGCAPTCDDLIPICAGCVPGCVCPFFRRIFDVAKHKCVSLRHCSTFLHPGTGSQFVSLSTVYPSLSISALSINHRSFSTNYFKSIQVILPSLSSSFYIPPYISLCECLFFHNRSLLRSQYRTNFCRPQESFLCSNTYSCSSSTCIQHSSKLFTFSSLGHRGHESRCLSAHCQDELSKQYLVTTACRLTSKKNVTDKKTYSN